MKYKTKKIINIVLSTIILIYTVGVNPVQIKAKTLRDLKAELEVMEKEYNSNKYEKNLTEEEISKTKASINQASLQIESAQTEIKDLNNEIIKLEDEIVIKKQEIRDFIKYYQMANGEPAYLEYVFGATDYTDFIYRLAITEQITNYNDKLINDYNKTIEESKAKTVQLQKKWEELEVKQEKLSVQMAELNGKLITITDESISIEEEIKLQRDAINYYEKTLKCNLDEDISKCGLNQLPPNTAFYRPIISGYVTSEFGQRSFDYHYGIDLSTTENNAPVYSAASGVVVGIIYKSSCGGNRIYINHNVNGKTYTTSYAHLRSILVSLGDVVSTNTQIGVMGGDPGVETYDKCTTGRHLHFQIANGLYLKDYKNYNTFTAKSFNPRNIVNLPAGRYKWFTNRTTKY